MGGKAAKPKRERLVCLSKSTIPKDYIFRYLHLGECEVSTGTGRNRGAVSRHGGRRAHERARKASASPL